MDIKINSIIFKSKNRKSHRVNAGQEKSARNSLEKSIAQNAIENRAASSLTRNDGALIDKFFPAKANDIRSCYKSTDKSGFFDYKTWRGVFDRKGTLSAQAKKCLKRVLKHYNLPENASLARILIRTTGLNYWL